MRESDIIIGILALICVLLGACANYLGNTMVARLRGAGVHTKKFKSAIEVVKEFRTYLALARNHGWPLWPAYAFWLLVISMLLLVVILAALVHYR